MAPPLAAVLGQACRHRSPFRSASQHGTDRGVGVAVQGTSALPGRAGRSIPLRTVELHVCHATFCNRARSFALNPATSPVMPTGLSPKSTARKTQAARYDPARVG